MHSVFLHIYSERIKTTAISTFIHFAVFINYEEAVFLTRPTLAAQFFEAIKIAYRSKCSSSAATPASRSWRKSHSSTARGGSTSSSPGSIQDNFEKNRMLAEFCSYFGRKMLPVEIKTIPISRADALPHRITFRDQAGVQLNHGAGEGVGIGTAIRLALETLGHCPSYHNRAVTDCGPARGRSCFPHSATHTGAARSVLGNHNSNTYSNELMQLKKAITHQFQKIQIINVPSIYFCAIYGYKILKIYGIEEIDDLTKKSERRKTLFFTVLFYVCCNTKFNAVFRYKSVANFRAAQHSHDEVRSENHTHKRVPDAGAKAQLERMMAPEARTTLTRSQQKGVSTTHGDSQGSAGSENHTHKISSRNAQLTPASPKQCLTADTGPHLIFSTDFLTSEKRSIVIIDEPLPNIFNIEGESTLMALCLRLSSSTAFTFCATLHSCLLDLSKDISNITRTRLLYQQKTTNHFHIKYTFLSYTPNKFSGPFPMILFFSKPVFSDHLTLCKVKKFLHLKILEKTHWACSSLDLTSDHSPVTIVIDTPLKSTLRTKQKTNWTKFKEIVQKKVHCNMPLRTAENLERSVEEFNTILRLAVTEATTTTATPSTYQPAGPGTSHLARGLKTQETQTPARIVFFKLVTSNMVFSKFLKIASFRVNQIFWRSVKQNFRLNQNTYKGSLSSAGHRSLPNLFGGLLVHNNEAPYGYFIPMGPGKSYRAEKTKTFIKITNYARESVTFNKHMGHSPTFLKKCARR
ncbi:unnamed protein product, partial [Trichogramma brassicae]